MPEPNFQERATLASRLFQTNRLEEARQLALEVLASAPAHQGMLYLVAIVEHGRENYSAALDFMRRAEAEQPTNHLFQAFLGELYRLLGKLESAEKHLRNAVNLAPAIPQSHVHLANVISQLGKIPEAIACYRRALELRPGDPIALTNLGNLLARYSSVEEAIKVLQEAVRRDPALAAAWMGLGSAFYLAGNADESVLAYRRADALRPDDAGIHHNLAHGLRDQGLLIESIAEYERALEIDPKYSVADSNRVYALLFHPECDEAVIADEMARWNQRHAAGITAIVTPRENDRSPDRRLRIGYVSPYFYSHAESFFFLPLLEHLDRSQVEIFCYSNSFQRDATTDRIAAGAGHWRNIRPLSDEQAAALIANDRIDILVDLAMQMAENRLLVFARKPAPVQVCWLAYPGGTGLSEMNYRITDRYIDAEPAPPGRKAAPEGHCGAESPLALANCWCCFDPVFDVPPAAKRGDRAICFGSLNNPCKLNGPLLRLWGRVLSAVQDSRLVLQVISRVHQDSIVALFLSAGIEPERLDFVPRLPRHAYLRLYDRIDICLDPLPYNGITTTCDALWMGVPVLSLPGNTPAGRAGLSILTHAGFPEWVASTPEEFVARAAGLAADRTRLAMLRGLLRQQMRGSPIMDGSSFARDMEAIYRNIWRTWCSEHVGNG